MIMYAINKIAKRVKRARNNQLSFDNMTPFQLNMGLIALTDGLWLM